MQSPALSAACPACPVETTLTLISDKWKVLILRDLMPGTKRFGELKKSIGTVTQKVLTAQLRQMEPADCSPAPSTRRFPPAWSTPSPTWGAASGLFWTPWKPGEKPTKKNAR